MNGRNLRALAIGVGVLLVCTVATSVRAEDYSHFHAQRVLAVAKARFAESDLHPSLWNGGPTVSSYLLTHTNARAGIAYNPSVATMVTNGESRLSAQTQLLINETILAGQTETFSTTVMRSVAATFVEESGATPPEGNWSLISWTETPIARRYLPDFEIPANIEDAVSSISLFSAAGSPPEPFSEVGNRHRALLGFGLDALSVEDDYLEAAYVLSRSPCIQAMPRECQLLGICLFRAGRWNLAKSWILRGREGTALSDPRESVIVTFCEQMMAE